MSELDDLLRRKAGLGTQVDIPKAELPADTNPHDSPEPETPNLPGEMGKKRVITVHRGGKKGSSKNVVVTRGGTSGTTLPAKDLEPTTEKVTKPGPGNSLYHKDTSVGDVYGFDEKAKRSGVMGTHDDSVAGTHVKDSNPYSADRTNKYLDAIEGYREYAGKYIDDLKGWTNGRLGLNLPSLDQANAWIKNLTGGKGTEVVANVDLKNEDLVGYVAHQIQNPWNLARIPVDIALRMLIWEQIKGSGVQKEQSKLAQDRYSDQWESLRTKEELRPKSSPVQAKSPGDPTSPEDFIEFELENNEIKEKIKQVSDYLVTHGFGENQSNELVDKELNFFTTYDRLRGFEFSDNFFWGVRIYPFDSEEAGYGPSLLPLFPKEFRAGWWPVTSCSFTKGSLQSKSFQLPFFKLEIPALGERPSNLKLSMVDNVRHAIRYWLEDYVRKAFNVDKNIALPYKNISWDITVYRYDCTMSTLYSKRLICLLSSYNAPFLGLENHSYDEIDLEFEIVGDYPDYDQLYVVNEKKSNFNDQDLPKELTTYYSEQ